MNAPATILVTDDRSDELALLSGMLTGAGYRVRPADSAERALASVAAERPDLVLLDVRLGAASGIEVCRQLRSAEGTRAIPIVLLSSFADDAARLEGLRLGAVDFLTRPFTPQDVLPRVRTHLELSTARASRERDAVALRELAENLQKEVAAYAPFERSLQQSLEASEHDRRAMLSVLEDRQRAEAEVRHLNESLEQQVRERTAQLEAVNGELESFAYSVSHDLRGPLRALDGFSAALLKELGGRLDASNRHYLDRIQNATRRMGQLIDALLALSRVTRREVARAPVDLTALAEEIAAELRAQDPARDAEIAIAPGMATLGDAHLLRIALGNLLENAWKFTATRADARIELGVEQGEGDRAFFVRDNGVGFDMTYADRLFAPFQRLHSEREFPGTGVGLATVRRIIARHGGRIWADAAVGGGATFHFTLESRDA